jgi:hypothetical protein
VVPDPFVVRDVEGTLANEGGGDWPKGVDVAIEIVSLGKDGRRSLAYASIPAGRFRIKKVAPGEYCFRVGVRPVGWSCVEGRIVVSPSAPREARVGVTVPLGR